MIENVSTQLTVFHCFAHCLLPGRAFASLYVLLFLEKEAEIGGRGIAKTRMVACSSHCFVCLFVCLLLYVPSQQLWSLRDGQFT